MVNSLFKTPAKEDHMASINNTVEVEEISCPYCRGTEHSHWASENGFSAVRCRDCKLLYVNPRPRQDLIDAAVKTGNHTEVAGGYNVVTKRNASKVTAYRRIFQELMADTLTKGKPFSFMDIGAGYGEVVEAVASLAPTGSRIEGIEPMTPKAEAARAMGLNVQEAYVNELDDQYDCVTLINILSHIPDFREFLEEIKSIVKPGGELIMETGNIAELSDASSVPGSLNLPDHLVFAGESHCIGFLEEAGFVDIRVKRERRDGFVRFGKLVVKKALGRPVNIRLPYQSKYRALFVRARRPN